MHLSDYSNVVFTDLFTNNNSDRYWRFTPENIKTANAAGLQHIQDSLSSGMLKIAILNEADFLNDQSVCPPLYVPTGDSHSEYPPDYFTSVYDYLYGAQMLFGTTGEYVPQYTPYDILMPGESPSIKITYELNPE